MDLEKVFIKTKKEKVIISELSLSVKRGEFLAILGPSGSGKTTLLDYLTGNFRGNLIYSGKRILHSDSKVKYVPQEDHLHGFYTVRQYFEQYITLNYGYSPTKEQRQKIITEIAKATDLTSLLDNRVGDVLLKGLSGGQKRRLSIALELISYPEVLILDEPTTGLDSHSALNIIDVLKNLTLQGICIIATIHQPSSHIWQRLDRTLLLSAGKIIYQGETEGAETFFASIGKPLPPNYNPADFFMSNINADFDSNINIDQMSQQWKEYSANGMKYIAPEPKNEATNNQDIPTNKNSNEKPIETQPVTVNNNSTNNDAITDNSPQKDKNQVSLNDQAMGGDQPVDNNHSNSTESIPSAVKQADQKVQEKALPITSEQVKTTIADVRTQDLSSPVKSHQLNFDEIFKTIPRKSNICERFLALSKRNFLNILKNPGIMIVRVVMYAMLCFFVGAIFFNVGDKFEEEDISSRANLIFYVNAFLIFMSMAALPFFMIERAIVSKEIINRIYEPFSYQAAAFLTNLPGIFVITLIATMFVVFMCNLQNFGVFLVLLFLALVIAENFTILYSLIVPHYIIGMASIAGAYGMFVLCQGYMVVKDEIPDYLIWGYYMAFHTYSYRGLMYNEFKDIAAFNSQQLPTGKHVLSLYQMNNIEIWEEVVILIGYSLAIQLCIYLVMKIRFRKRHQTGNQNSKEAIKN